MNVIELINKIKEVALSQETVNSVYDGDVYTNWNSAEVKYASVNIGLREISNDGNLTTYSVVFYYGDRLLQDKANVNAVWTDGTNTLQSIINILNTIDMIDITEPITYILFQQQFMDYLGGVYAMVNITTDNTIGFCNMNDYEYEDDKDKLIERLTEEVNTLRTEITNGFEIVNNAYSVIGEEPVETFEEIAYRITDSYYTHNFDDGLTDKFYNIHGALSTAYGDVTYDGTTISQCLKMESNTLVSFEYSEAGTLILVFNEISSGASIIVDDEDVYTIGTSKGGGCVLTINLEAGEHNIHTIEKEARNSYLYLIKLIPTID